MAETPIRHRNYRILRISALGFPEAAEIPYLENPGLRCCSFAEQKRSLLEAKIVHGDTLSRAMKSMGHETDEIVFDLEILQRTWAWERGIDVDDINWREQIVLEQIAEWKPEVLYLEGTGPLSYQVRRDIKLRFPFIEALVIFQGAVATSAGVFRELATADVLITDSIPLRRRCRDAGLSAHLVYRGIDPGVLSSLPAPSQAAKLPPFDFTFLGSAGQSGGDATRDPLLHALMSRTPLELWVHEARGPTETLDDEAEAGPFAECYQKRCQPGIFGMDFYKVLQRSRLTLDIHGGAWRGCVGNQRMFQATGVGACLVTDRGTNLSDLFEPDTEVVTYEGVDECVEKVTYLLEHEDERKAIADAGRRRALRDHSARGRHTEIDSIIQQALANRRRSLRSRWRGLSGTLSF